MLNPERIGTNACAPRYVPNRLVPPPKLFGSLTSTQPLRTCSGCPYPQPPEGGVDVGSRWVCAGCWIRRLSPQRKKAKVS